MIYKNDIRAQRIEFVLDENKMKIRIEIQLSNGKFWTLLPKAIDPNVFFNKDKLEAATLYLIGIAIKTLNSEMEEK